MKSWKEESSCDYSRYVFGYSFYAKFEQGDVLSDIYKKGLLPISRADMEEGVFYEARSLRVPLDSFELSSENKRILRKFDSLFSRKVIPVSKFDFCDPTFLRFCEEYLDKVLCLKDDKLSHILHTQLITDVVIYENSDGIGGYVFLVQDSIMAHYWFSFYAPLIVKQSFGIHMMLQEILAAQEHGREHIYLGTCYGNKGKYKMNFKPFEFWDGTSWVREKAFNLSKIPKSKSYKVSSAFVVTANAYKCYLEYNNIKGKFSSEKILNGKIPKNLDEEIRKSIKKIGKGSSFAVRSSSVKEDGRNKSNAGVFDTFLNTQSKEIFTAIKKVWASSCNTKKVSPMAVLVQEMISSEKSGIVFTKSKQNNIIIEAVFGLGECIVSGLVTPDYYALNNKGELFNTIINDQKYGLFLEKNTLKKKQLKDGDCPKLTFHEIDLIFKIVKKHFQGNRDIEWAYNKGSLYILQDRPAKSPIDQRVRLTKSVTRKNFFMFYSMFSKKIDSFFKDNINYIPKNSIAIYDDKSKSFVFYDSGIEFAIAFERLYKKFKRDGKLIKTVLKRAEKDFDQLIEHLNILEHEDASIDDLKKLFSKSESLYLHLMLMRLIFDYFENKTLKEKIKKLRSKSDGIMDRIMDVFAEFTKKNYPREVKLLPLMTSKEFFDLKKNKPSVKNGLGFIYKDKLYQTKELKKILDKNNLYLFDYDVDRLNLSEVRGLGVYEGIAKGEVLLVKENSDLTKVRKDHVLVVNMTNVRMMEILKLCKGIITDEGGTLCHAAIHARELKKPCLVGTKVATKLFKNGDRVRIDTKEGVARIIS